MPGTDIAFGPNSSMCVDTQLLDRMGMNLLSYDRGITHVQIRENGMKVAIVPSGNGNRMTIQRIVMGGSRLEDPETAGMAHVLEHADFRSMTPGEGGHYTWDGMRGIIGNAWTDMIAIGHTASLLVRTEPADEYHVNIALQFQRDTALGRNLIGIDPDALKNEIHNVKDEGMFNSQYGSQPRNLIQETNKLLLKYIWNGGWTEPTIGANAGQDLRMDDPNKLIRLHHALRNPSRTTLVLAGPIDPLKTLQLVKSLFTGAGDTVTPIEARAGLRTLKDLYENPTGLRPIPSTRTLLEPRFLASNISMDGGTRGICLGFPAAPYGIDTPVTMVIQQLVAVHAKNPAVEACGLTDVSMYFQPDMRGTVVSVLANVDRHDADENNALTRAQQALMTYVIRPILQFDDRIGLSGLLAQYRAMSLESTQSGPELTCALAIQGIRMADTPSLAWHNATLFSDKRITVHEIRRVATAIFNAPLRAVVRSTEFTGSAPPAPRPIYNASARFTPLHSLAKLFRSPRAQVQPFPAELMTKQDVWDLAGEQSTSVRLRPTFIGLNSDATIRTVTLRNAMTRTTYAVIAYNAIKALPTSRRRLTAMLSSVSDLGGWGSATIVTSALASIAKATGRKGVKFELQGGKLLATVEDSAAHPNSPAFVLPLVHTLAIASAISRGVRVRGLAQLAAQLTDAARNDAENEARKQYTDLSYMAQAQMRSQAIRPIENGYVPATFENAVTDIYAAKNAIMAGLSVVAAHMPTLAATNLEYAHIENTAKMIDKACRGATSTDVLPQLYESPSTAEVKVVDVVQVPGIGTFPYMAAIRGRRALKLQDRAALIVSNQLMVGGLGSAYSAAIRKSGTSYRPSGGIRMSWADTPVLTLTATFDPADREKGHAITQETIRHWASGTSKAFTESRFHTACTTIREQIRMRKLDFNAIQWDLLANLDPKKLGADQLIHQLESLTLKRTTDVLLHYFGKGANVMQTEVVAKRL